MLGHIMCCEVHRQNEAHLYWHSKAHSTCAVIKINHTRPGSTSHIQTTCLHPHLSQLIHQSQRGGFKNFELKNPNQTS